MASRRSGLGFEAFKSGTTLVLLLKSNSPTDYIKSVHVVHPILGHFFSDSWCPEVFLYNPLKLKVHKNNKSCRRITLKLFERHRIKSFSNFSRDKRQIFQETKATKPTALLSFYVIVIAAICGTGSLLWVTSESESAKRSKKKPHVKQVEQLQQFKYVSK